MEMHKFKVGDRVIIVPTNDAGPYLKKDTRIALDFNKPRIITKIHGDSHHLTDWEVGGYLFSRELKLVKKPTILIKMRDKNV